MPGQFTIKSSLVKFGGPAHVSTIFPNMPTGKLSHSDMVIEHHHDNGEPVQGAKFKAVLPDGTVRRGVLDALGKAVLKDVPRGNVKVTYGDDVSEAPVIVPEKFDFNWLKESHAKDHKKEDE